MKIRAFLPLDSDEESPSEDRLLTLIPLDSMLTTDIEQSQIPESAVQLLKLMDPSTSIIGGSNVPITFNFFISYRWDKIFDSEFVKLLYNYLEGNGLKVFLDRECLSLGQNFRKEFISKLMNSETILPIVSINAIKRFLTHAPTEIDNVLLEWMIALDCFSSKDSNNNSKIKRIIPIIVGEVVDDMVVNFFTHELYLKLLSSSTQPIIPKATIEKAEELLINSSFASPLSLPFHPITIQQILKLLLEQLGINLSDHPKTEQEEGQHSNLKTVLLKYVGSLLIK